jgi:hypothetical protein
MKKFRHLELPSLLCMLLLLSSCAEGRSTTVLPDTSTVSPLRSPSTSTEQIPTAGAFTATPSPTRIAPGVDASTVEGKVIFGYQGWFSCPGDGAGMGSWHHWFDWDRAPVVAHLTVDFWPDTSELTPGEYCRTQIVLPGGSPLIAFSSYNQTTVDRHFLWMEEYGIDGVEVQRFVALPRDPAEYRRFLDEVISNARTAAEAHGRVFYIQFAAVENAVVDSIKQDWRHLVDDLQVTNSSQYLHHEGRPLVGLFGLGLDGQAIDPEHARDLIAYFQSNPDPRYRATVKGGVPSYWRTQTHDAASDPEWGAVYRSLDVISPWSVGRYLDRAGANTYRDMVLGPDQEETSYLGIDYLPVVWPGFSWSNLMSSRHDQPAPPNEIPRNGGEFYWRQVYNALSVGSSMLYVAMFDEVDEGTAMFKLAVSSEELPGGGVLVPLDVDGQTLPSDWYLRLGGATGRMLRGEIPLSPEMPISP